MTVASRIITHQAICQSTSTFTSKATRPVTRAAAKTTTTQSKPTTSDTLLAHETAPWEVPGYEHLGLDTFVSKVGLTTAVALMPVTPIESVEAASDYIRDTKAHFVFATIEVGKAHAAVRKTAVCAHNLRLKIESARRAIDTCGFKDMMYLVDIVALGLEMATTKEMNLSCLAARNILAHRNASVNIAEQIAINAMATSDRPAASEPAEGEIIDLATLPVVELAQPEVYDFAPFTIYDPESVTVINPTSATIFGASYITYVDVNSSTTIYYYMYENADYYNIYGDNVYNGMWEGAPEAEYYSQEVNSAEVNPPMDSFNFEFAQPQDNEYRYENWNGTPEYEYYSQDNVSIEANELMDIIDEPQDVAYVGVGELY
ncbi:hypothetical protein GGH94_003751 [Coemansia aciculifera]|uniref:Uncharacterized protein n=1 Tax=Coemansia aciculifera TaxID=417176 RepID=A0A9W8M5G4_9FUNG|nr:hypothetical protein GGH94_003751 [Coemansia aciculifera]